VISRSQGAAWKALISMYIQTIPLSGGASCAAQNIFCWPPPRTPVSNAMTAKVGAAARQTQSAAPRAAVAGRFSGVPIARVIMAFHSFRRLS
jgi:hypothetical protein